MKIQNTMLKILQKSITKKSRKKKNNQRQTRLKNNSENIIEVKKNNEGNWKDIIILQDRKYGGK